MKTTRKRPQPGFGLVETMLTLGALSALSLGIYLVLSPTSAAAKAKVEQDNLRDLSTAVDRSFGLLGSFQGVSAVRVVEDGLAPTRMVDGSNLRTAWGTSVTVAPHTVNAPGDGFVVVYPFAPADVCPRLAAAVSRDAYDIRVEGVSMFDNGQLNVNATAAACGQHDTATMEFVYHSGLVAGTAVASPGLMLPPSLPPVSSPGTAPVGGPVGPVGPVTGATPVAPVTGAPVAPPAPVAPALPPVAAPVSPTTPVPPVASPVAPPVSSMPACVAPPPWTQTDSRSSPCPAGQIGLVLEGRTAQHSYTCPEAWDAPVETVSPWSAWTVTSSTCAPACSAPSPTSTAITRPLADQTQNVGCPAGQLGDHWQRRSVTESGTRTTSWACPGPTSSTTDTWSGSYTYGAWTTTSNNCVTPPADWSALIVTCEAKAFGGTYSARKERPFTAGGMLRCEADCKTSGSSINTCRDYSNTNAVFSWEVLASTDYQVTWAGDCAGTTGNRCSISLSGRRGSRSGTFTVVHVPTGEQRSMNFSGSYEAQDK